jgi:hypothetical protein
MTTTADVPPVSIDALLRQSWTLLRGNWVLVLPLVAASAVIFACLVVLTILAVAGGILGGLHGGSASTSTGTGILILFCAAAFFAIAALTAAYVALYGMADAAWTNGTARWSDGVAAARARLGDAFLAIVGFIGAGIAALVLLIPTLGIAMLALPVVTMYVIPAVVSGRFGGFAAFGESWRLVRRFFGTSLIAALILLAINYLISIVCSVVALPLQIVAASSSGSNAASIGALAAAVLFGGIVAIVGLALAYVYAAFYALAMTGLYRWLKARADAEDAAAYATAAP